MAASSPLDHETRFRQIQEMMEAPVSGRWVLAQSARFLEMLNLSRPEVESYLLPLAEPLAGRAEELDPVGLHPERIEALAVHLRNAQEHHPALARLGTMDEAEQALRRRAALLYAYAGDMERAFACLQPGEDAGGTPGPLDADEPRARFDEARSAADESELEPGVRWVAAYWDRAEKAGPAASVPMVERAPDWMQERSLEPSPVGALRRLNVELYGPSDTTDRLQVDVTAYGADEIDLAAVPLTAARQLLDDRHPRLQGRYVQGRLVFDHTRLRQKGRSAGLAVAALFYGAMLDYAHCRRRLRLRRTVSLTGDVTVEGQVQAVDGDTLSTKVQTVFFSPKTILVVPEAQVKAATQARDALQDEFPHGALDIVEVDRLDGLFYDRRLTRQRRIGWVQHTAQRLWARRGRVVAGTVIAGLLLVIAALLYGPIDKNPVAVGFAGEEMILKNKSGRVVERLSVGEPTVQSAQRSNYQAYRLGDIDENGSNEICWAPKDSGRSGDTPRLQCKGIGEDSLLWTLETRFDVSFPRKPAVTTEEFGAHHIRIGDFDANEETEMIVTLRHNKYFPYLVLKLDAETGRELGRYLHPGYFFSRPLIADLNEDGVEEILLTGMNNAYNQAVFTVLDPRYIEGHAPTQGDYVVRDADPAREITYLRIPPTVVDRAQPKTVNKGSKVIHYDNKDRILVEVWDGRLRGREERGSRILIQLNEHFRPVAIGTANQYDRLADQLVADGRIEAVPDYEYFQRYKQQFRYWTGSGWSQKPTINARWRKAAGTAWQPDTSVAKTGKGGARDSD